MRNNGVKGEGEREGEREGEGRRYGQWDDKGVFQPLQKAFVQPCATQDDECIPAGLPLIFKATPAN